jgi:PII-like signaling protein
MEKQKLAGATVFRGFEGFGEHHHMHFNKILSISQGLPIIIEIVGHLQHSF